MSGRIISSIGNQAVVEISSQTIPEFGCAVSVDGKKIGSVFDVIGSVKNPHVVVKLTSKAGGDVIGRIVSWGR